MKRFVCILLAVLTLTSLAACGKKDVSGLGTLTMENSSATAVPPLGGVSDEPKLEEKPETTPASQQPEPTKKPETETTPAPALLDTEPYTCELFSVTIPKGWNVEYNSFSVNNEGRINVFITDPDNPNNMIFYVLKLEPFFTDLSEKKKLLSMITDEKTKSVMEWAPVLDKGPTAESVLEEWAPMYTVWDAEGSLDIVKFKNYSKIEVFQTLEAEDNTLDHSLTAALACCRIPNDELEYGIYYETYMVHQTLNGVSFYTGYDNCGFVADSDVFTGNFDILLACKKSFDFAGFKGKYGIIEQTEGLDPSGLNPYLLHSCGQ